MIALATTLLAHAACAEDIKVGFNSDLSASPSALAGQAGVIGIEAAIEDINAAGGINGQKVIC
ncbi:ABC transporter substrate-binding protein [Brucella thiophenivorans]|uniref:ABC transporter substrate-binding protein n=1 Tax=Brucella thiophenivorans TaxID=571255 RepID=UPI0011812191